MCTCPFAKKALTLHLARGEGRERYFGCNLMQCKVLVRISSHRERRIQSKLNSESGEAEPLIEAMKCWVTSFPLIENVNLSYVRVV